MTALTATHSNRRSPIYRRHSQLQAQFEQLADAIIVNHYADPTMEALLAAHLGLVDLSTLPRSGFKGAGAPDWATSQGVNLPDAPNRAIRQSDHSLVARLSQQELLILADINANSTLINSLNQQQLPAQTYSLPRADSHSWLTLTGSTAAEMLAKICAVDLRPQQFAQGQVAQTSVAKINAVVIRQDMGSTLCFHILSDIAATEFLWDCLLDAMAEYQGVAIGVAALRSLAAAE